MRALAGKWDVGRLLEPTAIRNLLDKTQGCQGAVARAEDGEK